MGFRAFFLLALLVSPMALAQSPGILDGATLQSQDLRSVLQEVPPGSILILGENHGLHSHQRQQMAVLTGLRSLGHRVSVGLEFFSYTHQPLVDNYRAGRLSEADFLTAIGWGRPSYDFYRAQAVFPDRAQGSKTLALNAPRSLTAKVARSGMGSLSAEEQALLPPHFSLGRDSYRARFKAMMPHLPPGPAADRYFAAQSIWDDTMAWQAAEFRRAHPEQTLVIVVGEFHTQFGGGLPDRLRARLPDVSLFTLSQINTKGLSPSEIIKEITPSSHEGPRADWLWLAEDNGPAELTLFEL